MGSHVFKWPYEASDVHLTGSFDDWGKSIQMEKVGDEWVKEVDFPSADEKVLYKFVVDDEWKVDANLPTEGDGHYNTNNVLYPHQIKRKTDDLPGTFPETPAAEPTSFGVNPIPATAGTRNPITVAPGAPVPDPKSITSNTVQSTVTTSKEDYEKAGSGPMPVDTTKDAQEVSINPLPATSGLGNPVSVPAGEPLPAQKDITSNTIDSAVTTSKEDYEKAGTTATAPEPTFSVNPIGSNVTTSREAYENAGDTSAEQSVGVNPIPASSGIGNPISLPAGAPVPDQKEITSNTVDSTVTTSKEDYEKLGGLGTSPYTAAAAGVVGGALGGAALGSAFSVPEGKNIIPEASLPMGAPKTDTLGSGPFISSSGPGTTTADLAAKVPLETDPMISSSGPGTTTADLASKVPLEDDPFKASGGPDATTSQLASDLEVPLKNTPFIQSSGPGTTTAALAADVPLENTKDLAAAGPVTSSDVPAVVKESIAIAHEDPEAAASPEVVKEKAELEKELLSKTTVDEATGQPASSADDQTSYYGLATTVPKPVEESLQQAHAAPEAATETSAVAEKTLMEKELIEKVPTTDAAGEPAPTVTAVTSPTAPTSTAPADLATSVTDGKTANEPVPDTDTSTAARGPAAGEIAGGAIVGTTAAVGAAALAERHKDADVEPPRIPDSQKPDITTEASPATAIHDRVPGQSPSAAAAVSDGVEKPANLSDEPAVKMMNQIEGDGGKAKEVEPSTTTSVATGPTTGTTGATAPGNKDPSNVVAAAGVPSLTSAGTLASDPVKTDEAGPSTTTAGSPQVKIPTTPAKQSSHNAAASSPATSTATSDAEKKKKKRHRLSAFLHKVFD